MAPSPLAAQEYQIVDLGTLGGNYSSASGISENGLIAGEAATARGVQRAVIWDENGILDVGDRIRGDGVTHGVAVNDARQVATVDEGPEQTFDPYLWQDNTWTPIGVLPGLTDSIVSDIDSAGRVVGRSLILGPGAPDRGFIWEDGVFTDLGTLGDYTGAFGINEVGQVVGQSALVVGDNRVAQRAFLWEDGVMTNLGVLEGEDYSQAFDINDGGDVVGSSWHVLVPQFFWVHQATMWRDGGAEIIDLGHTPDPQATCGRSQYPVTVARAVNNHGDVVGYAHCTASGAPKAAFLWKDGVNHNLNDLIPRGSGWDLKSALDINDAGQIVGYGVRSPNTQYIRAFLLESATPPCLREPAWQCDGDVDGDAQVNPVDAGLVQAAFASTSDEDLCNYDMDCDGQINPVDSGIVQSLFGTCEAPRRVCP